MIPNWQRVLLAPNVNTGVPTVAFTVTVCVAEVLLPHPVAVAVMVELPNHNAVKVTAPVDELIVLPDPRLIASRE